MSRRSETRNPATSAQGGRVPSASADNAGSSVPTRCGPRAKDTKVQPSCRSRDSDIWVKSVPSQDGDVPHPSRAGSALVWTSRKARSAGSGRTSSTPAVTLNRVPFAAFADPWPLAAMRQGPSGRGMVLPARARRPVTVCPTTGASAAKAGPATMPSRRANHGTRAMSLRVMTAPTAGEGGVNTASWSSSDPVVECQRAFRRIFSSFPTLFRHLAGR